MQAKRIKLDLTPSHARYQVLISHAAMSRSLNGLQLVKPRRDAYSKQDAVKCGINYSIYKLGIILDYGFSCT